MLGSRADTIARLRVCKAAGVPVCPELIAAALDHLERDEGMAKLRARRDALIRRAALFLPSESPYKQAARLAGEAKAMNRLLRTKRSLDPDPATIQGCLHAAAMIDHLPTSHRQFYRVLRRLC
jgi:hypothetical protein